MKIDTWYRYIRKVSSKIPKLDPKEVIKPFTVDWLLYSKVLSYKTTNKKNSTLYEKLTPHSYHKLAEMEESTRTVCIDILEKKVDFYELTVRELTTLTRAFGYAMDVYEIKNQLLDIPTSLKNNQ
jgi:hypothetical protein